MRGTVSAGMALALHELGLVPAFNAVYGASAGAITGAWLLSSNPEGLRGWAEPSYAKTLIRWSSLLRGRPVVDIHEAHRGGVPDGVPDGLRLGAGQPRRVPPARHGRGHRRLDRPAPADRRSRRACGSRCARAPRCRSWPGRRCGCATGGSTTRAWPSRSRSAPRSPRAPRTSWCSAPAWCSAAVPHRERRRGRRRRGDAPAVNGDRGERACRRSAPAAPAFGAAAARAPHSATSRRNCGRPCSPASARTAADVARIAELEADGRALSIRPSAGGPAGQPADHRRRACSRPPSRRAARPSWAHSTAGRCY